VIDWLFRNRQTGERTVGQLPNVPLLVWLVARLVQVVTQPDGTVNTALTVVATGSLLFWAGDELVRGVNPFRRMVGGAVLAVVLVGLASR
jgi:hypothetical protein